jgi:hypothetical protein
LANNLPITALEPFLWDEGFRSQVLERLTDSDVATITNYFAHVYADLRRSEQITYAGSGLSRVALLTDLPVLRYSFAQPENRLPFQKIMDAGTSVIINLALRELEASRPLGCLITIGYEQAALSRADAATRNSHHLIVDEFHSFTTAEYTAKELARIDPLQVKHEVEDEYAIEKTHPVFSSLAEQWQSFAGYLQDLPPRHFALKLRGQKVKAGKTRNLPAPRVDPKELSEVEQEYLRRYFRSKVEIGVATVDESMSNQTEQQPIALYRKINRRESLIPD